MKAIILAAGLSTRTYPLTLTRPKPLLKVANKTLLEHNLDQLNEIVDEVIIIVGYKQDMIKDYLKDQYKNIKITYIEQKEQLGTGHAILQAKDLIKDRFIVMNGDDLYSQIDIKNCIKHQYCVLAKEVENPSIYGIFTVKDNKIIKITEKPNKPESNLANTGLYVFDKEIFNHELKKSERNEYEIIDYINWLIENKRIELEKMQDYHFPIAYPWDLLNANEYFVENIKENQIIGDIEDNVTIKGNIVVGKNTVIKSGTYIEGNVIIGEDCKLGPNCYIRGKTSIGNNCHIGASVEIKNSIVMDNSNVPHLNYVGDSIIGQNCNLGAGTNVANLRHDNKNVFVNVKDTLIDSGRRKLGTILGDNVKTAINTSIYPGRMFWPNTSTKPGEVVDKDKTN